MSTPKLKIIEPVKTAEIKSYEIINHTLTKRVCAYCRVSTDSEEQINSYNSQVRYYESFIKNHKGWLFAGIYADDGITGTSMKRRARFREMIDDALSGKIDMIICKSVSRFARNVVDILNVIEMLNQKGVPVLFENENLNSLDDKNGARLQILLCAANAEDYSQSLSASVKWGIRRQIENGNYPFSRCYGYNVKDKKVTINKNEAEVVKFIYKSFLEGDSYRQITKKLKERHILSPMGKEKWQPSAIEDILSNVRYKGDLHLQKTTTSDIKYRRQIKNETEKQYYITDHHQLIISKNEWAEAEKERLKRGSLRGFSESGRANHSSKYPFSNKIVCLQCGSKFRRHGYKTSTGDIATWVCVNHKTYQNCKQDPIKETELEKLFINALGEIVYNKDELFEKLIQNIFKIVNERKENDCTAKINEEINELQSRLLGLVKDINRGDVFSESQKILEEIQKLTKCKEEADFQLKQHNNELHSKESIEKVLNEINIFNKFNGEVFKALCDRVQIKENRINFVFKNMASVEKLI